MEPSAGGGEALEILALDGAGPVCGFAADPRAGPRTPRVHATMASMSAGSTPFADGDAGDGGASAISG
jgi:hypothetical protein